ncbi:erythrose-4-phosphate dehydrogenase [Sansalvadorimonas sp. 2012CJ34-2]|uniref:Erythrose-4-phosphate dehydrogenase n=1 Tax=Parendozoicomonas callyspongiae TaxID=2942213 RepID=A0ABT0PB21_9GAMM|nr:glyceraldehyde 3-phosphate dehydrogenase NAD-binding domain-containing protein [Sansalvadorimonas sp. 2012CJ34-2]MCL6268431.1 erythrose-4-phosphate dehydrogenase [Sansalvadorimonas sp. 2012CJ34-2]
MAYRVAINGYGRIGQCVLRALYENGYRDDIQVVAINELTDIRTLAYLTRYDTTHGRFPVEVSHSGDDLIVGGDHIRVLSQRDPARLPWDRQEINLLLECSGSFKDLQTAQQHLNGGAPRLLFSQPVTPEVDSTIVYGVNEEQVQAEHTIVSNASCTTNCIVPVLKLLHEAWGIDEGTITTIHSAMNDQPVIDAYHHSDLRLTRSALQSIIPVDTGLSKGIDRLLPDLAGRFQALAMRVPTINVSAMDLTVNLKSSVTVETVNQLMKQAASEGRLKGILGYTEEPHASVDFNHDRRSGVVDGTQTRVSGSSMLKIMCWFDNEWGFANRMLDVSRVWLNKALP